MAGCPPLAKPECSAAVSGVLVSSTSPVGSGLAVMSDTTPVMVALVVGPAVLEIVANGVRVTGDLVLEATRIGLCRE